MVSLSAWKPGTAKQYGSGVARTPLLGCNDRRRLGLTSLQSGRRAYRRLQLVVPTRAALPLGWVGAAAAVAATAAAADTQLGSSSAAANGSAGAGGAGGEGGEPAPPKVTTERASRLGVLVQLRKLYRNLLRAEALLEAPSPVYQPPARPEGELEAAEAARLADEEEARLNEAVEVVAEMELTAEQLKIGIRALKCAPLPFASVLDAESLEAAEAEVEGRIKAAYKALVGRAKEEVEFLPFPTQAAAHAALDARNARYRGHVSWFPDPTDSVSGEPGEGVIAGGGNSGGGGMATGGSISERGPGLGERLGKAERVAEEFVAKRLSPAVKKVAGTSPQGVLQGLRAGAAWSRDLWVRLNGGQGSLGDVVRLPEGLPPPAGSAAGREEHIGALTLSIDALEKKLQDASKARETKLRKAGIQGRARMAGELREMDDAVAALSRELAVRTLQLEMEYIYGGLEEEALDVVGESKGGPKLALSRRGSSDELALLAAEFADMDGQLCTLTALAEAGEALFISDDDLARLAMDIPDMRSRLGIGEATVFGGAGLGWVKVQLQFKEGVAKVVEGVNFGTRGVRLLVADVGSAGRLFWRAVTGSTLKPREVQALRRTFKDLLTFIPFAIILIAPLTPVGHVLVFGFIQRYFPGFFPSQFSTKRQELMMKYEELKRQLVDAQAQAEIESDELEFQKAATAAAAAVSGVRAAAAVGGGSGGGGGGGGGRRGGSSGGTRAAGAPGGGGPAKVAATGAAAVGAAAAASGLPDDSDVEGPAARAVRDLQEKLAAAADDSYTTDTD